MQNLTNEQAAALGGMLLGFGFVTIIVWVLMVIAAWRIFKKAGEPGWKALIPIYNFYILYKIAGMKNWFWISILVSFCCSLVISLFGGVNFNEDGSLASGVNNFAVIIYCAQMIFMLVVDIMHSVKLAKAFKKGTGFAIGLIFLPTIFWLILGFGASKYDKKVLKG